LNIDSQMMRQVFLNLAMNSVQSMPDGGSIKITARRKKGNAVVISFSDTGCGIKRKDIERVFDPFFTTREQGTGLGLAITQNIVNSHGGSITADSSPKGTTFTIELKAG